MHWLQRMAERDQFVSYVAAACALAFLTTMAVSIAWGLVVSGLVSTPEAIPRRSLDPNEPLLLFSIVVFAPLVETLIYRWLLMLLTAHARPVIAVVAAAVVAGALHGAYPLTFIPVTASFMLYGLYWYHWQSRSKAKAYWAPALAHSFANAALYGVAQFSA